MSNEWDDDDNGDDFESQLPNPARAKLRKLEKQNQDLLAKVTQFEQDAKRNDVADLLAAKGINPKVAKWVVADVTDVNPTSVEQWLTENSDLVGTVVPAAGTPATPAQTVEPDLSGLSAMQAAEAQGTPVASQGEDAILAAVLEAGKSNNPEAVFATLRANGIKVD